MNHGLCDVKGCQNLPLLGWQPMTERRGRQICEYHWNRHKDVTDSFNLFEAFNFRRPARMPKRQIKTEMCKCDCGRALAAGHRFCAICAEERERERKRQAYHERKNPKPEPIVQENILLCRACGGIRKPGYTYCPKCSERRSKQSNRVRQRRHYRKRITG
jgi:hypothetical protein